MLLLGCCLTDRCNVTSSSNGGVVVAAVVALVVVVVVADAGDETDWEA